MKRIVEIKPNPKAAGTVELGSTVILELENGTRKKFRILGTLETDPEKGIISHKSPLGAALMERKVGEIISVQTARSRQEYKIVEIN